MRPDWLNDAAKLHRVDVPMEPQPIFEGQCLLVSAAGERYLLAMKLVSGRVEDIGDCEHLIRSLEIVDEDELLNLISSSIPERLQTPRMAYFSSERMRGAWNRRRWRRWRASRRRRRASQKSSESRVISQTPHSKTISSDSSASEAIRSASAIQQTGTQPGVHRKCGAWMPRSRTYCGRKKGHRGRHRRSP